MTSLRARVLALVAGFGLLTAMALALVMHQSVRSYYVNVLYNQSGDFLDKVIETTPDLWEMYERDKLGFSDQLRKYVLFSPDMGLYLLDKEGRVLASAGEGKIFWSNYRVNMDTVRQSLDQDSSAPIYGDDPDFQGKGSIVAARPIKINGQDRAWLYVAARAADISTQMPELLRSYAIRTAVKVGLLTLAIGVLLTMATLALLAKPISALTAVVERVKNSGFQQDLCNTVVPNCDRNDEIGRLGRSFSEMFQRLRLEMQRVTQADATRREMVASVSHDLRTPLTALIGQLETIRMKGDAMSPPDKEQFLGRALNNAQHLKRLTDSLAELAKLDNPEFSTQPEPIAIGELADDLVQRYSSRAQDAGVKLTIEYPDALPFTKVDAALIERALANLLDNALRVTPSGGEVRVRVVRNGHDLRLEVADTGPGVLPEDQPLVFDRFFQASRHRETRGSSGLGLAIVKRVAELHGGSAGLHSEPGRGATFFIELPQAV